MKNLENMMLFEEFCNKCVAPKEDQELSANMRKKVKKNKYKDPIKDKKEMLL